MKIRRFTKADVPSMVLYLKEGLDDFHYKQLTFDAGKVTDTLLGNIKNPMFFCDVITTDDNEVIGALAGFLVEYPTSREVYAQDHILYVRQGFGHKFTDVTALVARYVAWAKKWGARQVRLDQSTGFKMEKFAVLAKRCGFHQIGTKWNMELMG